MSTRIYLVRHGVTDWNAAGRVQGRTDVPLNEEGCRQAHFAGRGLQGCDWAALYASDLLRAAHTAEIIGEYVGLPVQFHPGLRERDYGLLEGLTRREVARRFPDYPATEAGITGIEARADLQRRAAEALESIAAQHPGEQVIAVSHGGLIRAAVDGIGLDGNKQLGPLANAGFSAVEKQDIAWRILGVNMTQHLDNA